MNSFAPPQPDQSCDSQRDQAEAIAYEMAYGLSHELNNPLANIAGRARLLAEQETDPDKRQQLAIIVDQAMRGCEMIADLMLFARPPSWNPTEVDLQALLVSLCERATTACLDRQIRLNFESDPQLECTNVTGDRQALSEALWAVLRNALQAAQTHIHVQLSDRAGRLILKISDDGPGLSDKALSHAFHPYFSGREAGRGLGVGLSKAQRVVTLCGGSIAIGNRLASGCEVTIEIPSGPAKPM